MFKLECYGSTRQFQSAVAHELISNKPQSGSALRARAFQSAVAHELISNGDASGDHPEAECRFQSAVAHELISNEMSKITIQTTFSVSKRCRA